MENTDKPQDAQKEAFGQYPETRLQSFHLDRPTSESIHQKTEPAHQRNEKVQREIEAIYQNTESIRQRTETCQRLFEICQTKYDDQRLDTLCAQFHWWSLGIGASKHGNSLLDGLVHQNDVRKRILDLLDVLVLSLKNYIDAGASTPYMFMSPWFSFLLFVVPLGALTSFSSSRKVDLCPQTDTSGWNGNTGTAAADFVDPSHWCSVQ